MRLKVLIASLTLALLLALPSCGPQPTHTPRPSPTATAAELALTTEPAVTTLPAETPPRPPSEPTLQAVAVFEGAPCPFNLPAGQVEGETVDCGYLRVPEDRSDATSPTLRLAVAIFHQPNGDAKPDPIIYLEGGPGGSALELMALTFDQVFEPLLAAGRDIIVFDQRGAGLSEPALDCPAAIELGIELLDNELDGQELSDDAMYDLILETLWACEEELHAIANLSAYNSVANAADVNDLRLALGYDKVNLWGSSYGTRLALETMRTHPEGLRSVVLDSPYPPDVDLYVETPANADRAFRVLFSGCAADPACEAAYPELRTVFFDTVDRLNGAPATFQVTDPFARLTYDVVLDGDNLIGLLFQFLYETDVIPYLPRIIYDASQDNFNLIAPILGSLIAVRDSMSDGMQLSVQCQEELAFSSLQQFETVLLDYPELAGFFEFARPGRMSFDVCAGWDAGEASPNANQPVTSDLPTLILSGEYDPITPPAWGQRAATTLENSHFFIFPGVGHAASAVAGCPQEMILAFLEDPSAPPDDACIAAMDWPKFGVPGASAGPIELVPFTSQQFGIQGLIPAGWEEYRPGVYTRQNAALDVALVVVQTAPASASDLLGLLTGQLGLDETPQPVGRRSANGLVWTLYALEVQGLPVDLALADSDGKALLVMLQSADDEHDALYQAVFLPVVDALVPMP